MNALLTRDDSSRVFTSNSKKNGTQQELLWKKHVGAFLDIDKYYLQNEIQVLKNLRKYSSWQGKKFTVEVPKLHDVIQSPLELKFSTIFFSGKKLADSSNKKMLPVLSDVLGYLSFLKTKKTNTPLLGIRSPKSIFMSGIIYGLQASIKNPELYKECIHMTWQFCKEYKSALNNNNPLTLTHRDLDPDNIMVNGKNVLLADWENAILSDSLFDLAQIPRLYGRFIGIDKAITFCNSYLKTDEQKVRFSALLKYGVLQALAIKPKNTHMYRSALALFNFELANREISNNTQELVSPFEKIFYSSYRVLGAFYKVFPFFKKRIEDPIILCYHNVGNDNWRFTTPTDQFKSHLEFLNKNFEIKSLTEVIKTGNGLAITFDDGYLGVYENAFSEFKRIKKSATVFLIGNSSNPDRKELDNQLPLLDLKKINFLINAGWEMGFHTRTHADLSHLNKDELNVEIKKGKIELEKKLKIKLKYFAYPRGYYSDLVIQTVKKSGFKYGFTVDGKVFSKADDPITFHRIPLEGNIDVEFLDSYLTPLGLWIESTFVKVLQLKEQLQSQKYLQTERVLITSK